MTESNMPYAIAGVLWLMLVVSALVARRVPWGQAAKMAAIWIGIFALMFGIFAFRGEFAMVGQRMKSELLGTPVEQGGEIRIPMAEDGHFYVDARINGREARFLVDSGATTTTIAGEFADQIGVERSNGRMIVETANGTVGMAMTRADLRLGSIERENMRLLINEGDSTNVIGMNFLSSLSSWRVERNQLVLRP